MKFELFAALVICLFGMSIAQSTSSPTPTSSMSSDSSNSMSSPTSSGSGGGILSSLNSKASSMASQPTSNNGVPAVAALTGSSGTFYQTALFAIVFLASVVFMLA